MVRHEAGEGLRVPGALARASFCMGVKESRLVPAATRALLAARMRSSLRAVWDSCETGRAFPSDGRSSDGIDVLVTLATLHARGTHRGFHRSCDALGTAIAEARGVLLAEAGGRCDGLAAWVEGIVGMDEEAAFAALQNPLGAFALPQEALRAPHADDTQRTDDLASSGSASGALRAAMRGLEPEVAQLGERLRAAGRNGAEFVCKKLRFSQKLGRVVKCGNTVAEFFSIQLRSADEGMTAFAKCLVCKKITQLDGT